MFNCVYSSVECMFVVFNLYLVYQAVLSDMATNESVRCLRFSSKPWVMPLRIPRKIPIVSHEVPQKCPCQITKLFWLIKPLLPPRIPSTSSHAELLSCVQRPGVAVSVWGKPRKARGNSFISPELTTLSTLHNTICLSSLDTQLSLLIYFVCGTKRNRIKSLKGGKV